MRQGSCGFGRNPIRVIVCNLLLWRPLIVAKPEPSNPLDGWLLCYDMLASHPAPPVTIQTARPPISTGNIGKWLSDIFFVWKHYRWQCTSSLITSCSWQRKCMWLWDLATSALFSDPFIASPTLQLVIQPFRRFTYITTHSTTFPLLHLRHLTSRPWQQGINRKCALSLQLFIGAWCLF